MPQLILSLVGATGEGAVNTSMYLSEAYQDILKEQEQTQQAQAQLTTSLANNQRDATRAQASDESHMAGSTALQGAFTFGSSAAGGLSRLRSSPDTGLGNTAAAKKLLQNGNAAAGVQNAGAANPAAGNATVDQIRQRLSNVDFKKKLTPDEESALGQIKGLKDDVNNVQGAKDLYKETMKKIESHEQEARGAQDSHQRSLDLVDNRLSSLGQGMGGSFASIEQFAASSARYDQADSQAKQQYSQFANDSAGQNVQTQGKTADAVQQALLEAMRNEISGLVQAGTAA